MATRNDPFANFNFRVEIDGIITASFREVTGLESHIEVIEFREGTDRNFPTRKLPGKVSYSNIVLKYGVTNDVALFKWHMDWAKGAASAQRSNARITLQDREGKPLRAWLVHEAWPAVYKAPTFNAEDHEIAIETIELAHEGIELANI